MDTQKAKKKMEFIFSIISILMLLFCSFSNVKIDISFYQFLRWIISITVIIIGISHKNTPIFIVSCVFIFILFNPIAPIYLHDKSMWQIIDTVLAILLGLNLLIKQK